jgi:glycosyltransferase involved in cell wall biosynthesis
MNLHSEYRKSPQRLVTVIVPVRNMADKLTNLFSWLREADELEFQIILVCNKCTDRTRLQLEEFIEVTGLSNVLIIEFDEVGPGRARNYGMSFTEGKFTLFWDSDDVGSPQRVLDLINEFESHDALVAQYSTHNTSVLLNEVTFGELDSPEILGFAKNPGLWRCIFRSDSIKDLSFGLSSMGEDQVFLARFLATDPDIGFSPSIVYQYFKGVPNQLTSIRTNMNALTESLKEINAVLSQIPGRYLAETSTIYMRLCLTGIKRGNTALKVRFALKLFRFIITSELNNFGIRRKIDILFRLLSGTAHVN